MHKDLNFERLSMNIVLILNFKSMGRVQLGRIGSGHFKLTKSDIYAHFFVVKVYLADIDILTYRCNNCCCVMLHIKQKS